MQIEEKIDKYLNEQSNRGKIKNQLKKIMNDNNIKFNEIDPLTPRAAYVIKLDSPDKDFEKLKKILMKYETIMDIHKTRTLTYVEVANVAMDKGKLY